MDTPTLPHKYSLAVRSCSLSEVSIAIPDCYPMTVSTFSREYTILLRGEDNRNKWVEVNPHYDSDVGHTLSCIDST